MDFSEIITAILWGALFGNFSIQLLVALLMFVIAGHGLLKGTNPKSKALGFIVSPCIHFSVYSLLIYIGNYMVNEYWGMYKMMNKPVFIVFCVLGIVVSLIPIPKKIGTYWNLTHDSFFASMFEHFNSGKK